jgi:hypothetical protein
MVVSDPPPSYTFLMSEETLRSDEQPVPGMELPQAKYDAAKIDKLEGLEAVRKRPGMYIGDPDERGLHHCVFEVLDNSIDEHLAGHCKKIEVTIHVDGSCSIRDDGRGIPVDMHPKFQMPAVELVLTNLHSGGKFGQGAYKYSGGLHGVGAKCVNALSDWFKVEVYRNQKVYAIEFERGVTTRKLDVIGKSNHTGTLITFKPDPTIFHDHHRVQVRHAGKPVAGTRVPESRSRNRPDRRAGGRQTGALPLPGGNRAVRPAVGPNQAGASPQTHRALRTQG